MERLPNDQHNRERIFRELGEVMLAIEVAQARVKKALDTLDKNELFDDHAVSALKEAQGKLDPSFALQPSLPSSATIGVNNSGTTTEQLSSSVALGDPSLPRSHRSFSERDPG